MKEKKGTKKTRKLSSAPMEIEGPGSPIDSLPEKTGKEPAPAGDEDPKVLTPLLGDISANLVSYLEAFRSRFLYTLAFLLVVTVVSIFFSDRLLQIINKPYAVTGLKLNVFNLLDGFMLRLKVSLVAAIFISFPVIVYQIWRVVVPSIHSDDRRFMRVSLFFAVLLFYSGAMLTYFSLPMAIKALINFTPEKMISTINAMEYFSFVFVFCIAMGVVFELPIVIMILAKIGVVTTSFLVQKRKWAIVIIWIVAALLTPTVDPFTQSLVAVPLMLLYEVSIFMTKIISKRKERVSRSA